MKASRIPVLFLAIALAGCASGFRADVTSFHRLTGAAGETVEVRAMDEALRQSLEFERYAVLIGVHLGALGFTPPVAGVPSDLILEAGWASRSLGTETRGSPVSVGIAGGSGGIGFGTVIGVSDGDALAEEHRLDVTLDLRSTDERLYEGRAITVVRRGSLYETLPWLIDALFQDFPGESGVTRRITLETAN